MIRLEDFKNNDSLTKLIDQEISVIYNFINFESGKVEIHINLPRDEDYARGAFTLFGLSVAYKFGFEVNVDVVKIKSLYDKLHTKSLESDNKNHIYLILYGMRMHNNFNLDYKYLLEELKTENLASIYSYPVLTYIFMSTYKECEYMKQDKFLQSVYMQAYNTYEYILDTNKAYKYKRDEYLPFHFAELSAIDTYLGARADVTMRWRFLNNYPDLNAYLSGVAKCLEHYTRINDNFMIKRCIDFINTRSLSLSSEYLRPDLKANQNNLFRETSDSNYICLDTNTHLLLSYLNLYDPAKLKLGEVSNKILHHTV